MSLIGSLEDLSLGDILQIISLSQKSGVLVLRTAEGEGRIVFRRGLVSGANTKYGPRDLRGVLVGGGFVSDSAFDDAEAAGRSDGRTVEELLVAAKCVTAERLDSLRRESVESAVIEMFRWNSGDFSFDVREVPDPEDPQILLQIGVNAQYLAMEAARFDDEDDRRGASSDVEAVGAREMSAEEMFGVNTDAHDASRATGIDDREAPAQFETAAELEAEPDILGAADLASDAESRRLTIATLASAALRASAPSEFEPLADAILEATERALAPEIELADDATQHHIDWAPPVAEHESAAVETLAATQREAEPEPAISQFDPSRPIVVIDSDLAALEWTKSSLADSFERVHIFQRSDLGLTRIRQYLARAVAPIVLIAPETPGDRLSGIRDARDFVRRLKQQSARTQVVWLQEDGSSALESVEPADAIAIRPAAHHLRNRSAREHVRSLAAQLVTLLCEAGSAEAPRAFASLLTTSGADLESLKRVTQHLRDASSRGEVLPKVIDFAAGSFRRVAMWMIRDGVAVGMAQRGFQVRGSSGDDALRELQIPVEQSAMLSRVVNERAPASGAPTGEGDRALALALGDTVPAQFYLAPIESGGRVVAVVYGDDLPGELRACDTSALEVVLHHAGLALDRASLERALAEAESDLAG